MAVDVWFPLAIYYDDVAGSREHKDAMVLRIRELHEEGGSQRTSNEAAWTGDIHRAEKIHLDPTFEWLTDQVGRHSFEYLKLLGHDLEKIDLYIQRSWPVISKKGQYVSQHAHHTSHLSVVYYVSVPKQGNSGRTRFFNTLKPNEISEGISSSMTLGYSSFNPLNYGSANYDPIEGRILIFPSKQMHDVEANETAEERISVSYDLVLCARDDVSAGSYEFLMPPPKQWLKIHRHTGQSGESPAQGRGVSKEQPA